MDRRVFIGSLAGGLLAVPLGAEAQPAGKVYRIGVLGQGYLPTPEELARSPFRSGLRDLGWMPGRNIVIENRRSVSIESLDGLAKELIYLKPDVIVTFGVPSTRAAVRATTTIPIVMVTGVDPVANGFVASLSRPGGNVTGLTSINTDLAVKRIELIKEVIPGISRVAYLWNPTTNPGAPVGVNEMVRLAATMGIRIQSLPVQGPDDFAGAFAAMATERAGALWVSSDAMMALNRARLVELVRKHRLPTISSFREDAEAGTLMVYAADLGDLYRRMATYVDKILKGAKPADLPIEQPTKFELVINLKTAKALGLMIPPSLLQRADQVIE